MAHKSPANRKTSNIWQNAKTGRWHYEVALKRKDGTTFRGAGSRKEEAAARAARDLIFAEFNSSEGRAGKWTLATWTKHVQENVWPEELAATTADAYNYSLINHVLPKLGGAKLDGIGVPALQEWSNRLTESKGRNAAASALTALSSILTRAVEAGCLTGNPARNVKLRKVQTDETKMILTREQETQLLDAATGTCMELPVLLGLRFGLRMGECLGLKWSDVDVLAREIRVRQQSQYVKGKGNTFTDPKSRQGARTLPIPDGLLSVLAAAKSSSDSIFVCLKNGRLISSKKASSLFREVALAAGFAKETGIPTHHDLRSTFLTRLANHANGGIGVKPHVLMAIAGHSNIQTTMKYYIRASTDDLRRAMACVS